MSVRFACSRKWASIAILCAAAPASANAKSASASMSIEATVVHSLDAEQQEGVLALRTSPSALLVPDDGISVSGEDGLWTAAGSGPSETRYLTIVYY